MAHSTRRPISCVLLLAILLATAGAAPLPPAPAWSPDALSGLRFKAVLIAGDRHTQAFDHATKVMRDLLIARQVSPADIQRLSAAPAVMARAGVRSSGLANVLAAIERMRPASGEGCLVFATSHGSYEEGLFLAPSDNFLTPAALDAALLRGCGDAPTVAVISGCFSGTFTQPPMTRANRIILTAAREDRPSFGCGAGFQYTVYDRCLLRAMGSAATWPAAYDVIRTCVSERESALHFQPSEPRAFFGDAVRSMPLPIAPTTGR